MATCVLNFFIISDVHGDESALEKFCTIAKKENPNAVLIAGDLCPSSPYFIQLLKNLPCSYHLVRGNCDSLWDYSDYDLQIPQYTKEIPFGDRTIGLTHGHLYYKDNYPYKFKKGDIFIYGHTHRAEMTNGNPIILNPGSIARPRGTKERTFIKLYSDRAELWSLENKKLSVLAFAT